MKKIRQRITNLSLQYKIRLIFLSCSLLFLMGTAFVMQLLLHNYNKLLQESVHTSVSYANKEITDKLENIEKLSYTILADPNVQRVLNQMEQTTSPTERSDYYTELGSLLQIYYLNHFEDNVSYINLFSDRMNWYTNKIRSASLTPQISSQVKESALDSSGSAVWITEHSQSQGLMLAREIRNYNQLRLNTLGVLLINVDLQKLLHSSTLHSQYGDFYYLLADRQQNVIYTSSLKESAHLFRTYENFSDKNYRIVRLDGHWFFTVSGQIYTQGWNYICMVSYDSIHNTLQNAVILSILLMAICFGGVLFLSKYMIGSLTKPFTSLLLKMKRFGKGESLNPGDLGLKTSYSSRTDEIGMLHKQFDLMVLQITRLINDNYTYQLLAKDSQIKALEMQINPHFLYNTLESINWRAKAIGETEISMMVEALGNLFRAVLSQPMETFTLEQELELIKYYLTIQEYRFDNRLIYHMDIDHTISHAKVPKMMIQPLVENAISHGMEASLGKCYINITIASEENDIFIYVRNSGSYFEEDLLAKLEHQVITPRGLGIGLLNINQRIKLMFGDGYGLELYNADGLAVAQICIPYQPL